LTVIFELLGSACVKVAYKILVKSTLDRGWGAGLRRGWVKGKSGPKRLAANNRA
jgi:hypothetical protein